MSQRIADPYNRIELEDNVSLLREKPLSLSAVSDAEVSAELDKGYSDMLAGNTRPAAEVFAFLHSLDPSVAGDTDL